MKPRILVVFTLIAMMADTVFVAAAPPAPSTTPAQLGQNAALDYLMAFMWLNRWDPKQRRLIEQYDTLPLEQAGDLVPDRSSPLKYLRFGAKRPSCDWGLHLDEEGFSALLPYLNEVRNLARLGLLRSRVELRDGRRQAAADYWAADLALARHTGAGDILVSLRVDYGIEAITIDHASLHLKELDKPALDHLSELLNSLPPAGSPAQGVRVYRRMNQWLVRQIQNSANEQWENLMAETFSQPPDKIHAIVQACGGTGQAVIQKIQDLGPIYDQAADAMSLPYDQFQRTYPAIDARFKANPISPMLSVDFGKTYQIAAAARARMELFQTALAVLRQGPDVVATHADPFGNGPFTYRATAEGFELSSKMLDVDGHQVVMRVGKPD